MLPVRPETLRAQFTTRVQDFWRVQREISLYGPNGDSIWYVHPQFQKKRIDVVAIPLDSAINDDPEIGLYPINSLRSDVDLQMAIGMDVFVLGYPFGFSPPGLPIWKRGSVASEPDIVHLADGFLLIDTASRPGMSGAPVIRRSWGAHTLAGGGTSSNSTPRASLSASILAVDIPKTLRTLSSAWSG